MRMLRACGAWWRPWRAGARTPRRQRWTASCTRSAACAATCAPSYGSLSITLCTLLCWSVKVGGRAIAGGGKQGMRQSTMTAHVSMPCGVPILQPRRHRCVFLCQSLRLRATQEHNELVERYDAGADAWSVVELAPGAEPFKRAFMSCCVL